MDDTPVEHTPKQERMQIGPVAAIIILVLMFAVGGIYFFLHEQARLTAPPVQETITV